MLTVAAETYNGEERDELLFLAICQLYLRHRLLVAIPPALPPIP